MGDPNVRTTKISSAVLLLIFLAGFLAGGIATAYIVFEQISGLRKNVLNLQAQISKLWDFQNITYQNVTIYQNGTALSDVYNSVKDSVVLIQGITSGGGLVQGSGFVYNFSSIIVVMTNYHVVHDVTTASVTFSNGNAYTASVKGTDPYADFAVLSVNAPEYEFKPLEIVSSSTLNVGDPVIAIGNPYGLVGSLTTGVVSALGRTITEEYTGGFAIANVIQTSAPINPGNSGGPLLNFDRKVIGITTAIVQDSQGLGFAIPANTILREVEALITHGSYEGHSYLGVNGVDMDYLAAQDMGVKVTFGWRIVNVVVNGPSHQKLRVDDVIIAMNETRITNGDKLASYLEENTLPGETLLVTVVRENQEKDVVLTLGRRPRPLI